MRISFNIMLFFSRKLEKISQDLSSASVVIGPLRVKNSEDQTVWTQTHQT